MNLESEPLPAGIREHYEAHLVSQLPEDYNEGCIAWSGPVKLPTRPGGTATPHLYFNGRVYSAALVAWAIENNKDYPYCYYRIDCGDLRCINPKHVSIRVPRAPGGQFRVRSLEDTVHFQERLELALQLLTFTPDLTVYEISSKFREAGIGGKNKTMSAVIQQARSQLGLRNRIPAKRPKVTE